MQPALETQMTTAVDPRLAGKQAPGSEAKPHPKPKQGWLAGLWTGLNRGNGWAWATGGALIALLVVGLYAYQNVNQMQMRLRQAGAEREQVQREIAQLETENSQVQEQLQQAEADRSQLQTEAAQLDQANGQLQERLRQVEADLDQLQAEVVQLQADNEQLSQANQNLIQQLQTEQGRLDLIVNSAPVVVPGTEAAPEALGIIYLSSDNEQVLMILHGLSPLPPDKTYQLWLIPTDQSPVPAGLVTIQSQEPTLMLAQVPPQAREFSAVGISIEPSGGSLAPTGPIVLLGTVG
jgi:anti-sigma-K factor RskA